MVARIVDLTIYLHGQGEFRAIEIQNIGADRVLTPEPEMALQALADLDP